MSLVLGVTFATLDAGVSALGEARLCAVRDGGGADGRTANRILRSGARIQARYLVGRVMCVALAAGLAFHLALSYGGFASGLLAVSIVAFLYSALAEVATTVVRHRAGTLALLIARWLRPLELLMAPVAAPLAALGALVLRSIPRRSEPGDATMVEREVEHVIEQGEESGSITQDHAALLRSVLEFKNTVAREVMVPRTQMKALELATPLKEVLDFIIDERHSRYPVYRERIDEVVGVLCAKDLFRVVEENRLAGTCLGDMLRKPVFFVAESQKIGTLLKEMQSRRVHLAVVSDEFGGTSGVVTLEDILEEIVGEIHDEHDEGEAPVRQLEVDRYLADGSVQIDDLEAYLQARLRPPEHVAEEYDTLAGLLMAVSGRVPERGESVLVGGFRLTVREGDARHVQRVEITRIAP